MSTTDFFMLNISMDNRAEGEKKLEFIITDSSPLSVVLQTRPSGGPGFLHRIVPRRPYNVLPCYAK